MSIQIRFERTRLISTLLPLIACACQTVSEDGVAPSSAALQTDAAASGVHAVDWGPCEEEGLSNSGAVCAMLSVPLDYDKPHGAKIQIALSMVEHTVSDDQYQGIMLANPGGPGGSGLFMSTLGPAIPKDAGLAYDWIGFDPRGVGASVPSLHCIDDYLAGPRPQYVPTSAELEQTWLKRSEEYATACGVNGGELLKHIRTTDVVQDLDSIRAALHAPKLNYYGFSYGTYIGQVYATTFPDRVGRMVLDANVNPTRVFYEANLDQDIAFQDNAEAWWAWVAQHDDTYHLGASSKAVEQAWYAELRKLRETPAGGVVGPDEWTDIFLQTGYSEGAWAPLTELWVAWINGGDAAPLVDEYQSANSPGDDNLFAIYNAVQCTDAIWPSSWSKWRSDNWAVFREAPFETWGNAWFNAPCLFWPAQPAAAVDVDGTNAPPVLILGQTLDAATPFEGSLEVRRRFPKASLIATEGGRTHGASLGGNDCIDDRVADYLASGALPARKDADGPDASCDRLPFPEPAAPAPVYASSFAHLKLSAALTHRTRLSR